MMEQQSLYSSNLKTKGKTYFFDVKQSKNGNKYLTISESWISKDGQKKRSTLSVFPNNLVAFGKAITDIQDKVI